MNQEAKPTISVITPAYNSERFIKDAIQSVMDQTYQNWEMIIVDDCSSDDTVKYVKDMQKQDDRIRLISLEENSGSAIARNTALGKAYGRYVAFLDSDDRWMPEKMDRQLAFMRQNDIAFSFTSYVRTLEDGTMTDYVSKTPRTVDWNALMKRCVIGCLTVMIDTEKTGPVRMVNIRTRQDYALWLELTRRGFTAHGLKDVLAKYRVVDGSISSNKLKAAKRNWYLFRNIESLSIPKTLWYFGHYAVIAVKDLIKFKIMINRGSGKVNSDHQ
ncbi:glycosyltransferase family 2 protein [Salinicoccus roseus]|uniref:glycosyltransferase family 2 protein n=1 Tax=Salinicoccus roseus TaxID=45670 RepID=UPI001EF64C78|nr:glycosyltransferase family 2 protein [Salinicoccus roseus]MCG7333021.1 glycosyltransferase family 2 protein [Salinicoccus roseus]